MKKREEEYIWRPIYVKSETFTIIVKKKKKQRKRKSRRREKVMHIP